VKGYKVFNPDWTCRGFQYEVGQVYEMDEKPICCGRGFHFCEKASDCFRHYNFNPDNKVAEVEAFGDIDTDGTKSCTNKIKIIRELTWHEVLDLVNIGKDCTGICNSGNRNSGDWNSGDCNSGNRNSGNRNSGDWNSGDCNSGDWNSGDCNSGNRNSGDWNSGNRNSGDWNKSSFNNGCFNTVEPTIMMFNKPSEITYQDWRKSDARYLLNQIPKDVVEWIWSNDMTDEEKAAHPEHETTGGYLKVLDESECSQIWWDGLTDKQKGIIRAIPNFDKSIFEEITGIRIE
jgi:hypothetical protein